MAAPSNTVWGNIITGSTSTRKGRIGISATVTTTNTQVKVAIETWFWSMYSISDSSNKYYYNAASSATSLIGSANINHTVSSGSGWSTSNQTKLGATTYTYNRGTSAATKYYAAKLTDIDSLGSSNVTSVVTSINVPALTSYAVKYNANGGTGAPSAQTKYYGTTLKLSTTKPTRTGYSFQGWSTANDSSVEYASGANYTANAAVTLYAVWKANTYTITFDANGGAGAPANQTKTYGVTLTLSSVKPTRQYYNFLGWSASKTATTATYKAGGSYTNNTAVTLYAVWELAYTKPKITNVSVSRCDSSGAAVTNGTYTLVKFNWSTTYTATKYTITVNGITTTTDLSATSGSVSVIIGGGALSTEKSYTVAIMVYDSGGSTGTQRTIPSAVFPIDFLAGGKGVAFGKVAENEEYVESAWPMMNYHSDLAYGHKHPNSGNIINFGVGSGGVNRGMHDPQLGRWLAYGDGTNFYYGTAYGNTKPYFSPGDTVKVAVQTGGYITNSGKHMSFTIPLAKPLVGCSAVSVSSVQGLTIRQNGLYAYGSSASAYVTPDSYIATHWSNNCICVTAEFSNTTNVANNDACGVVANIQLTFS